MYIFFSHVIGVDDQEYNDSSGRSLSFENYGLWLKHTSLLSIIIDKWSPLAALAAILNVRLNVISEPHGPRGVTLGRTLSGGG
jgi:hypothetical protein